MGAWYQWTLLLFSSFIASATLSYASPELSASNTVNVGYATYLGNQSYPNTVAYLGIPYAEPPLGELRFRAPLPLNTTRVAESTGGQVVNATEYPEFCIQGTTGAGDAGGAGSEDCLKVNIYAPAGANRTSKLPVLFYIHGGGYVYGNPRNWPFDGWIHQSPNVVIVSVYYRLDSFGFLASPAFSDPSYGDFNAGFLDQLQALRWINQYIEAFGGDPEQVTINGQSAGGSSVELHLVAHEGEPQLFSKAIAQSVYRVPVPTPEEQQPLFDFYTQQAGCGLGSVAAQLACLRSTSVSALARAQDAASYNFTGLYNEFHPVRDGAIITDIPSKLIMEGKSARVPLIVGSTSNETLSGGTNITTALKAYFPGLTSTDLADFLVVYPEPEFDSAAQRFQVATGEPDVICAREIMGGAFANYTQAWTYRYNQPNPTSGTLAVEHAAENWMMFDGTNTGFNGSTTFTMQTPEELAFTSELIAYWLSFVRAGDPNTYKLPQSPIWLPYEASGKLRIVLQQDPQNNTAVSGSYIEMEPAVESARCAFVASIIADTED